MGVARSQRQRRSGARPLPGHRRHQRGDVAGTERDRRARLRHHARVGPAAGPHYRHAGTDRGARHAPPDPFRRGHPSRRHPVERDPGTQWRPAQPARYRTGAGEFQARADRRGRYPDQPGRRRRRRTWPERPGGAVVAATAGPLQPQPGRFRQQGHRQDPGRCDDVAGPRAAPERPVLRQPQP